MKITNNNIYNYTTNLLTEFNTPSQQLPIKINFYLQKNIQTLRPLAQEIEQARQEIIRQYGILQPDNETYKIPEDKILTAQKELVDLLNLEQEVQIYTVKIDDLDKDLMLSMGQMEALMFMIE